MSEDVPPHTLEILQKFEWRSARIAPSPPPPQMHIINVCKIRWLFRALSSLLFLINHGLLDLLRDFRELVPVKNYEKT